MADKEVQIYHERQSLQFCLLHALNNLFQDENAFTRKILNDIATELALENPYVEPWSLKSLVVKPHHNVLTGNYDANVLEEALRRKGKITEWHNVRQHASAVNLNDDSLMGIVLNVIKMGFRGMWKSRHWMALGKINGVWYNLDSELKSPHMFEDTQEVGAFLDNVIHGGAQILVVRDHRQPVYHERQRKKYCLLHALNNLFQRREAFTRKSLNNIAKRLLLDDPGRQWWTPLTLYFNRHYNVFTGNYDVHVLDAALRSKKKTIVWHDNREDASLIDLKEDDLMGIILNIDLHWVALRKIEEYWYDLDSSLDFPGRFTDLDQFLRFLNNMRANDAQILLIKNG